MQYSEITYKDKNPIKRYFHNKRFKDAVLLYPKNIENKTVLDYGGGDGELCRRLAELDYKSKFICYEPTPTLFEQARKNIGANDKIIVVRKMEHIASESIDIVYCLEVFEHLPINELEAAVNRFFSILKPNGTVIVGIPNELFMAALYKGIFRMTRRLGDYDARLINILKCAIGKPPKDRPIDDIYHGTKYHYHHLGFDHRRIIPIFNGRFKLNDTVYSPFRFIGEWGTSGLYYIFTK